MRDSSICHRQGIMQCVDGEMCAGVGKVGSRGPGKGGVPARDVGRPWVTLHPVVVLGECLPCHMHHGPCCDRQECANGGVCGAGRGGEGLGPSC